MKKIKKLMPVLLSFVFVVSTFMTITVFAAEAEQNGLVATLTFDKPEYAANEDVNVTLTVKNNNSYAVKDIQTEITLPDGVTLKDGSLTQEAFELNSTESKTCELIKIVKATEPTTDTTSQQTGDNSHTGLFVVLMILSGGALLFIGIKQKKLHAKGTMSLILCFAMAGAMLPMTANATSEKKSFSVEETVKIDDKNVTVKATVSYAFEQYSDVTVTDGTATITANEVPEAEDLANQMKDYYLNDTEPEGNTFYNYNISKMSLPETDETGKCKFLKLPLYRQSHNFTCGVACVASVLRYAGYDFDTREDRLLWELAATPENGTNYVNITEYLDAVRIDDFPNTPVIATEVVCEDYASNDLTLTDSLLSQLRAALDDDSPVICAIQAWRDDGDYKAKTEDDGHYVVLIGYKKDTEKDTYIYYFMDPSTAGSYTYLTEEEFSLR
ncbi:MAG: C39 family peptidase, partial [bacterium]|nr:C39 family peptidase [bacterium]